MTDVLDGSIHEELDKIPNKLTTELISTQSDRVLRITSSSEDYLVKIFSNSTDLLFNTSTEKLLMKSNPDIFIHYYGKDGYIVNYYSGCRSLSADDITNRRVGLLNTIKTYHYSDLSSKYYFLEFRVYDKLKTYYNYIKSKLYESSSKCVQFRSYLEKLNSIKTIIQSISYIEQTSSRIPKVMCYGNLSNKYVFVNENDNSIKFINHELSGINDAAWDYSSLLLETYDPVMYYSCLANNKLISKLDQWYNDDHIRLRVTICMMLQDYMWCLIDMIYMINSSSNKLEDIDKRCNRVMRFLTSSMTTIEYYYRVYEEDYKVYENFTKDFS